jgi:molybdopterin-guanine dinucleotide biosynthesis protein A
MKAPETVWGLVLAGGKSRRMGSDKALLVQDGETQLSRAVSLLAEHVDRVFVSTRADQAGDAERSKFEQIVDRYENMGPVAGILSAMDSNTEVNWLILACDLPNIDDATLACLLEQCSAEHPVTAYESIHDGLPEPLCAIYRPDARAMIDGFVEQGTICPRKMLINSDTHLLAQPNPGALHNINSPEDLAGTGIDAAL